MANDKVKDPKDTEETTFSVIGLEDVTCALPDSTLRNRINEGSLENLYVARRMVALIVSSQVKPLVDTIARLRDSLMQER